MPASVLWEVATQACADAKVVVDESDRAAGLCRATEIERERGSQRSWELRMRSVSEDPPAASLQVMLQDLLALDGGTKLPQAVGEFFTRVESLMRERGLDTSPPVATEPLPERRRPSALLWVGAVFAVLIILVGLSFSGVLNPRPSARDQALLTPPTPPSPEDEPMTKPAAAEGSVVRIQTPRGDIVVETFDKQAPITAGNFLLLVKEGFYNGLTFHRVVPDFVIQGGDPQGTGAGGPGFTIPDELKPELKHDRGMLSMAKTAMPDTAGSQFFIVTGPQQAVSHLDMKHAVFGKVLQGMDVADKIQVGDKMVQVTLEKESPDAAAAMEKAKQARVPGNR